MFYSFNQINNRIYHFITDEGVLYNLLFSLEESELVLDKTISSTIYNIILTPLDSKKVKGRDFKIGKTIYNIICDFESKNPNCCFTYTPDFTDGKHHVRNWLFNRWIDSHGSTKYNAINLEVNHISINETYYSTLLYSNNYSYGNEVTVAFEKKIMEYQVSKA